VKVDVAQHDIETLVVEELGGARSIREWCHVEAIVEHADERAPKGRLVLDEEQTRKCVVTA
jgi:hypothetical protein